MLVPGALVVALIGALHRLQGALALADLLEHALDVSLQRFLQRAELLVEGGLGALGFPEDGLLLRVFEALAFDGLAPLGQVLFGPDEGAALSNSAAARAIASTSVASVGRRRSAAACLSWRVRASVSATALSRVARAVSASSRVRASSAAWVLAASAAFASGRVAGSSRRARRQASCWLEARGAWAACAL